MSIKFNISTRVSPATMDAWNALLLDANTTTPTLLREIIHGVLAARDVKLERDAIVEHHRRLIKGALKCGPTGANFVARVAG